MSEAENKKKKILMVMPSLPYPETGAEQADRAWGIRYLKELGYEVRILAKWPSHRSDELVIEAEKEFGVKIFTVPYIYSNAKISWLLKVEKVFKQIFQPYFWDGAAFEYNEPLIKKKINNLLVEWKPDFVWFEYTYLWPLYKFVQAKKIPIITRSLNFEPEHFWQEDGSGLINYFKYLAKINSEKEVIKKSDVILAITPNEAEIYKKMGAKRVLTLPLRSLGNLIKKTKSRDFVNKKLLKVFFLGSTYNVKHNFLALKFLLREIIPLANETLSNRLEFHIFGAKVPKELSLDLPKNVIIRGYVENLDEALIDMDIALIPSLAGAGMQQKVFEPFVRGIPLITSERALAGYPIASGDELLLAETREDFVAKLKDLVSRPDLSARLSSQAVAKSKELFSIEQIESIIKQAFYKIR